jgi:hypothetical protein
VSAAFEHERRKTEYHLYWYNAKKGIYNDFHRYQCLSHKLLNKREMKLFLQLVNKYKKEIESEDGIIWVNKDIGFNKDKVIIPQYQLLV